MSLSILADKADETHAIWQHMVHALHAALVHDYDAWCIITTDV